MSIELRYDGRVLATVTKDIKKLELVNQGIKDIGRIENLEKLEMLDSLRFSGNEISDISGVDGLGSLRYLAIEWQPQAKVSEIKGLDGLENLNSLTLTDQNITRITGLDSLRNLQHLMLSNNPITRLSGLDNMAGLRSLTIAESSLESIDGLDALVNLRLLELSFAHITEIRGLEALNNLTILDLQHNHIRVMRGLDTLENLGSLFLEHNAIKKIEGLDALVKLDTLGLGENRITKIENLNALHNLKRLDLPGNRIMMIEGLGAQGRLESLDLQGNRIRAVAGLGTLENLRELRIGENPLPKALLQQAVSNDGYAYEPDAFVAYCNGDVEALLPPEMKKPAGPADIAGIDSILPIRKADGKRFVVKREKRLKDYVYLAYHPHFELFLYHFNVKNEDVMRRFADVLLGEQSTAFLYGRAPLGKVKPPKYESDGVITYEELYDKAGSISEEYLITSVFMGDKERARRWLDVMLHSYAANERKTNSLFFRLMLLINNDIDKLFENLEQVYKIHEKLEKGPEPDAPYGFISIEFYLYKVLKAIELKNVKEARQFLEDLQKRILKENLDTIFYYYYNSYVLLKEYVDIAGGAEPRFIFTNRKEKNL